MFKAETANCIICNKKINKKSINFAQNLICRSCFNKMPFIYKKFLVEGCECLVIYKYNEFIKEIIYRIKAQGDKKLSIVLLSPLKTIIETKYKDYTILPMPSSKHSNSKRGFNHVVEIFKILNLKMNNAFIKKDNYKQSNQSKFRRISVEKHIILHEELVNKKSKILLVDDITTTHQTLADAVKKLKRIGVENIKILAICIKENKNEKR